MEGKLKFHVWISRKVVHPKAQGSQAANKQEVSMVVTSGRLVHG
jgi:hypothetical protein